MRGRLCRFKQTIGGTQYNLEVQCDSYPDDCTPWIYTAHHDGRELDEHEVEALSESMTDDELGDLTTNCLTDWAGG